MVLHPKACIKKKTLNMENSKINPSKGESLSPGCDVVKRGKKEKLKEMINGNHSKDTILCLYAVFSSTSILRLSIG